MFYRCPARDSYKGSSLGDFRYLELRFQRIWLEHFAQKERSFAKRITLGWHLWSSFMTWP
jgi:outer membrane translocation and assembly module TamA